MGLDNGKDDENGGGQRTYKKARFDTTWSAKNCGEKVK
jgi:hypothetical protein